MTGIPLVFVFILSIIAMILLISKWKVHPFLAIMLISAILGLLGGIPLISSVGEGGKKIMGLPEVIGAGFSSTFSSIGIVIIFGAMIGTFLEVTGAALKLADMVIKLVGPHRPELAIELMGWVVSIPVFCDSGFVVLNPIRKALVKRTGASSVAMTVCLSAGLYASHVFIPPTPGPIAAANTLGIGNQFLLVMLSERSAQFLLLLLLTSMLSTSVKRNRLAMRRILTLLRRPMKNSLQNMGNCQMALWLLRLSLFLSYSWPSLILPL